MTVDGNDYVYWAGYVEGTIGMGTYEGNGDIVVMKCLAENGGQMWSLMLGSTGADGVTAGS